MTWTLQVIQAGGGVGGMIISIGSQPFSLYILPSIMLENHVQTSRSSLKLPL